MFTLWDLNYVYTERIMGFFPLQWCGELALGFERSN